MGIGHGLGPQMWCLRVNSNAPKPCYIVIMCKFTSINFLKLELVPNGAIGPSLASKLSLHEVIIYTTQLLVNIDHMKSSFEDHHTTSILGQCRL